MLWVVGLVAVVLLSFCRLLSLCVLFLFTLGCASSITFKAFASHGVAFFSSNDLLMAFRCAWLLHPAGAKQKHRSVELPTWIVSLLLFLDSPRANWMIIQVTLWFGGSSFLQLCVTGWNFLCWFSTSGSCYKLRHLHGLNLQVLLKKELKTIDHIQHHPPTLYIPLKKTNQHKTDRYSSWSQQLQSIFKSHEAGDLLAKLGPKELGKFGMSQRWLTVHDRNAG